MPIGMDDCYGFLPESVTTISSKIENRIRTLIGAYRENDARLDDFAAVFVRETANALCLCETIEPTQSPILYDKDFAIDPFQLLAVSVKTAADDNLKRLKHGVPLSEGGLKLICHHCNKCQTPVNPDAKKFSIVENLWKTGVRPNKTLTGLFIP